MPGFLIDHGGNCNITCADPYVPTTCVAYVSNSCTVFYNITKYDIRQLQEKGLLDSVALLDYFNFASFSSAKKGITELLSGVFACNKQVVSTNNKLLAP